MATPATYPASATPLRTASAGRAAPAATPSSTMLPVITLPNTLPSARNEVASTAPVVRVSSTTSKSRIGTWERLMADPNPPGRQATPEQVTVVSGRLAAGPPTAGAGAIK